MYFNFFKINLITYYIKQNKKLKKVSLEITFKQQNFSTLIVMDVEKTVGELLKEIKIKNKNIKRKNYKILENFDEVDGMENEAIYFYLPLLK